jgi:hypothetical protein
MHWSIQHRISSWLVLDLKVQKCTDIESMPGF